MTDKHLITPPPELVNQWCHQAGDEIKTSPQWFQKVATQAARWGADMELEACCSWADATGWCGAGDMLCAARRSKPPSLKAGAIEVLDELDGLFELPAGHYNTILRALEQLDDSL